MSSTPSLASSVLSPERREQLFAKLTPAQIDRIAAVGRERRVSKGEILINQGDLGMSFFVLRSGRVDIVQPSEEGELLIAQHEPGGFIGELNTLTGGRAMVCVRVAEPGDVIELEREKLQRLVQTDVELSEILMRGFI